jgi:hypothetical protein
MMPGAPQGGYWGARAAERSVPAAARDLLGRHALRFTGRHAGSGWRFVLVALPDGGAFDLLGLSG